MRELIVISPPILAYKYKYFNKIDKTQERWCTYVRGDDKVFYAIINSRNPIDPDYFKNEIFAQ